MLAISFPTISLICSAALPLILLCTKFHHLPEDINQRRQQNQISSFLHCLTTFRGAILVSQSFSPSITYPAAMITLITIFWWGLAVVLKHWFIVFRYRTSLVLAQQVWSGNLPSTTNGKSVLDANIFVKRRATQGNVWWITTRVFAPLQFVFIVPSALVVLDVHSSTVLGISCVLLIPFLCILAIFTCFNRLHCFVKIDQCLFIAILLVWIGVATSLVVASSEEMPSFLWDYTTQWTMVLFLIISDLINFVRFRTKTAGNSSLKFRAMMKRADAFALFVEHIIRESSVEHLLFLLEIIYYKSQVRGDGSADIEESAGWILDVCAEYWLGASVSSPVDGKEQAKHCCFSDFCCEEDVFPLSPIASLSSASSISLHVKSLGGQTHDSPSNGTRTPWSVGEAIIHANYIFDTYIDPNGRCSINISYDTRETLIKLFRLDEPDGLGDMRPSLRSTQTSSRSMSNGLRVPRESQTLSLALGDLVGEPSPRRGWTIRTSGTLSGLRPDILNPTLDSEIAEEVLGYEDQCSYQSTPSASPEPLTYCAQSKTHNSAGTLSFPVSLDVPRKPSERQLSQTTITASDVSLAMQRLPRPLLAKKSRNIILTCFDEAAVAVERLLQRDSFGRFLAMYPEALC